MTRSRRFSIAGLMGAVLVAALALAALSSGSESWGFAAFLVTCGVLAIGFVGVVCGGASERPWWLGFFVFGGGYLYWALGVPDGSMPRKSAVILRLGKLLLRYRIQQPAPGGFAGESPYDFVVVVHCLLGLLAAVLGGALARFLFPPPVRPSAPDEGVPTSALPRQNGWRRPVMLGLVSLFVFTSAALTGLPVASWVWPGATILLTWGLLGFAVLGAALNRGVSRARWLGAALFGISYLVMVSGQLNSLTWPQYATNRFLNSVRPYLFWVPHRYAPAGLAPHVNDDVAVANLRIQNALDQTVPIHFPKDTPLENVLTHIETAIRRPDGHSVPIYVDPVGLIEAEQTLHSPVSLDLEEGIPLRTSLRLILEPLGMAYEVNYGVIKITCESCLEPHHEPEFTFTDPFLLTGQCLLALLAAGLGSLLAPLVITRGNNPTVIS